jgi:nucleotide-binding universal stress UspA family protein
MKMLIATDGSEFSKRAFEKACSFFKDAHDLEIMIVSVFDAAAPVAMEPYIGVTSYYVDLTDSIKKCAESFAGDAFQTIEKILPDAELTSKVRMGTPAQTILDTADGWKADLIVVGSHGHGFWGRLTLGSVSDAIIHHAKCSVLVVREP